MKTMIVAISSSNNNTNIAVEERSKGSELLRTESIPTFLAPKQEVQVPPELQPHPCRRETLRRAVPRHLYRSMPRMQNRPEEQPKSSLPTEEWSKDLIRIKCGDTSKVHHELVPANRQCRRRRLDLEALTTYRQSDRRRPGCLWMKQIQNTRKFDGKHPRRIDISLQSNLGF